MDSKDVNVFALRSNFEKETVPDSSIRQRYVTKRVHAHRKKQKKTKPKKPTKVLTEYVFMSPEMSCLRMVGEENEVECTAKAKMSKAKFLVVAK